MHLHEEHRQKLSVLFVLLGTGDTDRHGRFTPSQ